MNHYEVYGLNMFRSAKTADFADLKDNVVQAGVNYFRWIWRDESSVHVGLVG